MKAIVPIEVIKRKSFDMRTESYILTTPSKCITIRISNTNQKGKVKVNDNRSSQNHAEGAGDDSEGNSGEAQS